MQTGSTDRPRYLTRGAGIVLVLLFGGAILLPGCRSSRGQGVSAGPDNPFHSIVAEEVAVVGSGHEPSDPIAEACADFELDRRQIARFLQRSRVVTSREIHDSFELYPCWVDASADRGGTRWQIRLRIGGVASARGESGGSQGHLWLVGELADTRGVPAAEGNSGSGRRRR